MLKPPANTTHLLFKILKWCEGEGDWNTTFHCLTPHHPIGLSPDLLAVGGYCLVMIDAWSLGTSLLQFNVFETNWFSIDCEMVTCLYHHYLSVFNLVINWLFQSTKMQTERNSHWKSVVHRQILNHRSFRKKNTRYMKTFQASTTL